MIVNRAIGLDDNMGCSQSISPPGGLVLLCGPLMTCGLDTVWGHSIVCHTLRSSTASPRGLGGGGKFRSPRARIWTKFRPQRVVCKNLDQNEPFLLAPHPDCRIRNAQTLFGGVLYINLIHFRVPDHDKMVFHSSLPATEPPLFP